MHFFNALFGWKLENLNSIKQNVEAIDLIDRDNKIVIQVSATATREKVESALTKDLSAYTGYSFKFISISKDASALRSRIFANLHNLHFIPQTDIYDIASILKVIGGLGIDDQKRIYEFLKKELEIEADPPKQAAMKSKDNVLKRQLVALLKHMKNQGQNETIVLGRPKRETIVEIARLEAELESL